MTQAQKTLKKPQTPKAKPVVRKKAHSLREAGYADQDRGIHSPARVLQDQISDLINAVDAPEVKKWPPIYGLTGAFILSVVFWVGRIMSLNH